MPFPPLRPIEAAEFDHGGTRMALLTDPEGLLADPVAVGLLFFLILTMMDGRSETADIQSALMRATGGQIVPAAQIEHVASEADRLYLFDNERSAARRLEIAQAYDALPARPARHAGSAYPESPEACRAYFDALFDGLPRGAEAVPDAPAGRPRGLIVPHIDYRVGGRTIAKGFAPLDAARPSKLYIILGVAHRPTHNLFTLGAKDFETPLGLVRADQAAAARLQQLYGADLLHGELAHKDEHSVEFAAIALRYLHGDAPFAILPILCGSLHELIVPGGPSPESAPVVGDFIEALRTIVAERPGEVCIVASVDLSHVGLKFGDPKPVDLPRAVGVGEADRRMLAMAGVMDPEGFFDHFRGDANARNVDAVCAVYVLLKVLGPGTCRQIEYEQWREQETGSMVTFASLALY